MIDIIFGFGCFVFGCYFATCLICKKVTGTWNILKYKGLKDMISNSKL